jgi:CheY-like chemotaxis protein
MVKLLSPCPKPLAVCGSLRLVTAHNHAEYRPAILLAYHGKIVRRILAATLLHQGYDVTLCDDGRAAVRQLAVAHFDLIVTGIIMPNMDGLELIRFLQSENAPPPILAVAEDNDPVSPIYLRIATLIGATGAHVISADSTELIADVDWILNRRADVPKEVVW